jgi:hypothetical protein
LEELSSFAVVLEEEAGSDRRRLRHQRSEAGSSICSIQRREARVFCFEVKEAIEAGLYVFRSIEVFKCV